MSFVGERPGNAENKQEGKTRNRRFHSLAVYAFLLCIYVFAVILRWGIVGCLADYYGDLPYTMESTLLFHYADAYSRGERIPEVDTRAQHPEGLEVSRKLSLGKGLVAAALYRILATPAPFRDFVRRFDAAWFCLGIFAVFLLVRQMGGGDVGGLIAAACYAVSLPAVARSTGLEFSRENFSLPLIFLHWWLIVRGAGRTRLSCLSVVAGVFVAAAAATWDVTQLYILLAGVFAALSLLFGKGGSRFIREFLPGVACLIIAGATVPYLRDHAFLFSWGMLVWYSLAVAFLARALLGGRAFPVPKVVFLVVLASLLIVVIGQTAYPGTYSHFAKLFLAKVRYLNHKPINPAKLSYEARILWTPALHSATSRFQGGYPVADFRYVLVMGAVPLVLLVRALFKRNSTEAERALLFWLVVFVVLYLLFVRMEVFLVFFACGLIGLGMRYGSSLFRNRIARSAVLTLWSLLVFAGLAGEAYTYSRFDKIYRVAKSHSPYLANGALVKWLRENTEGDAVVLADFTLEPTIFAEAGRAIVLHPKFESKGMRRKVREYLEALFSRKEKDFYDFCVKNGADYYVLHPGVFAGPMLGGSPNKDWIYSSRYMVGRVERNPEYASFAMRDLPERLQYFKKLTDVSLVGDRFGFFYRVFRVVSESEIEEAARHVAKAQDALGNVATADWGSLQRAEEELLRAVELFPGSLEAHSRLAAVYQHKYELKARDEDKYRASEEVQRCKQIITDRGS